MPVTRDTYYGSGTIYEFVKPVSFTMPSTESAIKTFVQTNCTADNELGFLKNGFSTQLSTENLEDQPDLGQMKVSLITKETATMTFALFNSNGATLSRLYPSAKTSGKITTVGGLANASQAEHVIVFVGAQKNDDGEQDVFIAIGKNTSGFTLNWNPDSVEPFSCEYSVIPFNSDGNLYKMGKISNLPTLPITADTVYTITFETNGGEFDESYTVPESYVHGTGSDITLPTSSNISKEDATFAGWFETDDLSTAVTTIDVSEDYGNRVFFAKWTTG